MTKKVKTITLTCLDNILIHKLFDKQKGVFLKRKKGVIWLVDQVMIEGLHEIIKFLTWLIKFKKKSLADIMRIKKYRRYDSDVEPLNCSLIVWVFSNQR